MPEGPEVRREAAAIAGRDSQRVFVGLPELKRHERRLRGRVVEGVETRGKAFLTRFEGGWVVCSHSQLYGRWMVRRAGELRRTNRQRRFAVRNAEHSALLYSASAIQVLRELELATHPFQAVARVALRRIRPGGSAGPRLRHRDPSRDRRRKARLPLPARSACAVEPRGFRVGSRDRRRRRFERTSRLVLATLVGTASLGAYADDVARGDAAWAGRAEGEREGRPMPGPIREAVRAYESALAASPGSLEARWKLLRALHFEGEFVAREEQEKRRAFDRAREVSEEGLDRLARQAGAGARLDDLETRDIASRLAASGVPATDVARLYFWSAINWGAWSQQVGLLRAVRRGVANRLYRYTTIAIALEPDYDEGGALRLLGRLHAELPRVPFVSGWVDRKQALPLIERAYELAPANPGNRLLLALTLLDLAPERRAEALGLLEQVQELTPRPSMRSEDLAMRREARERLAAERGG